jgi:hypothetical protein
MKAFSAPVHTPRPRGARLLEAFSPKLERRVRHFDYCNFRQWLRLEADPGVLAFCERPIRLRPDPDAAFVDFWVRRRDGETLQLLESGQQHNVEPQIEGVDVHIVSAADLAADSTWIANWQTMLPVIIAARSLVPKSLTNAILRRIHEPLAMATVERELSRGDPGVLRAAIFDLLRTGQIQAPLLRTHPLTLHILLEPAT